MTPLRHETRQGGSPRAAANDADLRLLFHRVSVGWKDLPLEPAPPGFSIIFSLSIIVKKITAIRGFLLTRRGYGKL
jgi:hypothetical protein